MIIKLIGRVLYQEVERDESKSSLDVFLDDDKGKKEEKKEEIVKEEKVEGKEEEVKEEKEIKEDEVVDDLARVEFAEITKEFPEFFKKFPTLKHAFFREQQFTEIYPTVEDAKAAAESQTQLEEITEVVVSGDVGQFLTDLKDENEEGYKKFTANFIPTLFKADRDLYLEIISPEVSRFLKNVFEFGKKNNSENIQNAAKIVRKELFGGAYEDIDKEITEPLAAPKKSANEEKLEKELAANEQKKYNDLHQTVTNECYSALETEINKGLADLKGKEGISRLIAKDIKQQILDEMGKDGGYMNRMNAIWKKEARNGFSGTNKETFKATFLAKAKAMLPKIRAKVRKDTLGAEDVVKEEVKRPEPGRHTAGGGSSSAKIKEAAKTSTKAIFDA